MESVKEVRKTENKPKPMHPDVAFQQLIFFIIGHILILRWKAFVPKQNIILPNKKFLSNSICHDDFVFFPFKTLVK